MQATYLTKTRFGGGNSEPSALAQAAIIAPTRGAETGAQPCAAAIEGRTAQPHKKWAVPSVLFVYMPTLFSNA